MVLSAPLFFVNTLNEWESSPLLQSCLNIRENFEKPNLFTTSDALPVLSFNVRGISNRMQEMLLRLLSLKFDVIILLEVGVFESSMIGPYDALQRLPGNCM